MAWDKSDSLKRLPKIIETKNVLDKKIENDIKETFNRGQALGCSQSQTEEFIVSYRK